MYLLFDIGGTNMRLAVSNDKKKIDKIKIVPTPQNFSEAMLLFKKTAIELSDGKKIKVVVGGVPGPMDKKKTMIMSSPNLSRWNKKPLKKTLENIFKCIVRIEKDVNLAGLGEAVFGSGKGKKVVVFFTISTGVGGARIINGKIDDSTMFAEPGFQIIKCDDLFGYLEGLISGTALRRRYKKIAHEITDKKIWDKTAYFLAIGIHNTILHWNPDMIVLGGSVMKSLSLDKVNFYLKKVLKIYLKSPKIKNAELGDSAGLYGALAFLNYLKFT